MIKRYAVNSAFAYTFGKDTEPTWITRQNADQDIPRMAKEDRDAYIARNFITEVQSEETVEERPLASAPVALDPVDTDVDSTVHVPRKHTKGGK